MDVVHKKPIRDEVKDLREAWKVPHEQLKNELLDKHTQMVQDFYLQLFEKIFGRPYGQEGDEQLFQLNNYPNGECRLYIKGIGEVGTVLTEIGRIGFTPFPEFTDKTEKL